NSLKTKTIERLHEGIDTFQVEDGTIFYWKSASPQRLYVKWKGNEIHATLPGKNIDMYGVGYNNAIYFCCRKKIYKAVFAITDGIIISPVRDLLSGENVHWTICSRVRYRKRYVYCLSEDPGENEILVDVPDEEMKDMEVAAIHRGTVILFSET
ncbi:hypothetical protein PENTCL1PPCAC_20538, partial [Pristionchus entomophagus]